jgi:hypothetical protein
MLFTCCDIKTSVRKLITASSVAQYMGICECEWVLLQRRKRAMRLSEPFKLRYHFQSSISSYYPYHLSYAYLPIYPSITHHLSTYLSVCLYVLLTYCVLFRQSYCWGFMSVASLSCLEQVSWSPGLKIFLPLFQDFY